MRTALFWVVTQRVVVNFLPKFRDNLSDPSSGFFFYSWTLNVGPTGCPETSGRISTTRCVTTQNSAVLSYFAAEVCKHAKSIMMGSTEAIINAHKILIGKRKWNRLLKTH
jgi:hypothetical protein